MLSTVVAEGGIDGTEREDVQDVPLPEGYIYLPVVYSPSFGVCSKR